MQNFNKLALQSLHQHEQHVTGCKKYSVYKKCPWTVWTGTTATLLVLLVFTCVTSLIIVLYPSTYISMVKNKKENKTNCKECVAGLVYHNSNTCYPCTSSKTKWNIPKNCSSNWKNKKNQT